MELVFVGVILLALSRVYRLGKAVLRRKCKKQYVRNRDNCKKILLIVPVYKEQERIRQFIDMIEKISYEKELLHIIFCTTEKEVRDGLDTHTVLEDVLRKKEYYYSYEIVRYPEIDGNMAHQVNYTYKMRGKDFEIVGIYNADSVIYGDIFYEVSERFSDSSINYVQQRITFSNYDGKNLFSKGYIYYQSAFDIIKNDDKDYRNKGENVCGRGLYIRQEVLEDEIYPEDFFCEDMALSFKLVSKQEKIAGISHLEENEPPAKLGDIINQQYVWFHTASRIKELYNYAMDGVLYKGSKQIKTKVIRRICDNIIWCCASPTLVVMCCLWRWFILLILLYSLVYCILVCQLFYVKRKILLGDVLGFMMYLFILSLGPAKCIYIRLRNLFCNTSGEVKYKTPRRRNKGEKADNYSR